MKHSINYFLTSGKALIQQGAGVLYNILIEIDDTS